MNVINELDELNKLTSDIAAIQSQLDAEDEDEPTTAKRQQLHGRVSAMRETREYLLSRQRDSCIDAHSAIG